MLSAKPFKVQAFRLELLSIGRLQAFEGDYAAMLGELKNCLSIQDLPYSEVDLQLTSSSFSWKLCCHGWRII
jgi:hypothetical protein